MQGGLFLNFSRIVIILKVFNLLYLFFKVKMSKTGQNNTCQLHIQMKGSESVKYKARKHFPSKKKINLHLFTLSNNAFKCCNSFKTLTYWYKLVIASYTLNAIFCKRVPCGKISLTLIYFFDVWVVSSWCNQNTQWKTGLFYQMTKLQTSYLQIKGYFRTMVFPLIWRPRT